MTTTIETGIVEEDLAPETNHQSEILEKHETKTKSKDGETVVPAAPDGGWGWMVVFGSFMIHVIADGIAYSFGVYVEDFKDYFDCNSADVGMLGSLILGVTWGTGE